jgi:anthranilate phosphoribosyltransferase
VKEYIQKITERQNLNRDEAASAMRIIMEGGATEAQIVAFLIALRLKEEQPEELLGFVEVMRENSVKVTLADHNAIDMCGTGGDGSGTFNISTVASFVVAGAGVTVAKHGNRSVSSSCGSADVLKALGVNIELSPNKIETCINTVGIGFLFAPLFHPAMKYAAKPRSELGVKTCFNMLGPMTNPAGVQRQLVGAFSQQVAIKIASVYQQLKPTLVIVVSSHDGLDEVSLHSPTTVHEVNALTSPREYTIDPASFNFPVTEQSALRGGSANVNASIAMAVLRGEHGPHRNIVIVNAAFGLQVAGKASSVEAGMNFAEESIDSGSALHKLQQLKEFSNR